jgi:hypothetical protein
MARKIKTADISLLKHESVKIDDYKEESIM